MSLYLRTVQVDPSLLPSELCFEDKVDMAPTGVVHEYEPPLSGWSVEYKCPRCGELVSIHNREVEPLILQALRACGIEP
ncbi:MAG: hypothetical protein MJE77_13810 [Proteobacteria bacterium]|nr:hypothetical protein [Pseudomonadota bacterium]